MGDFSISTVLHEYQENRAELRRHHRDFAAISEILDNDEISDTQKLLHIRNIVG